MSDAATTFLNALDAEQRARAALPFDDHERLTWNYTPVPRKGLPLKEMTATQRALAFALLSAGLSQRGYMKAMTIISLEEVLHILEQGTGPVRDPDLYFFTIFGEPSENGIWAYRVEGHHVSHHFTLVDGKVIGTPSFFGANPAMIREGPRHGLRTLPHEEDLARALVLSLDPDQRNTAIVDQTAYPDILTKNSRQAALRGEPSGLQSTNMDEAQRHTLEKLLEEYAQNMTEPLAEARRNQIAAAGHDIYFAWSGGTARGEPHYYRVQSARFLVEYDDTQNGANHIHSVWRDFDGDFGRDVLAEHYRSSHSMKK